MDWWIFLWCVTLLYATLVWAHLTLLHGQYKDAPLPGNNLADETSSYDMFSEYTDNLWHITWHDTTLHKWCVMLSDILVSHYVNNTLCAWYILWNHVLWQLLYIEKLHFFHAPMKTVKYWDWLLPAEGRVFMGGNISHRQPVINKLYKDLHNTLIASYFAHNTYFPKFNLPTSYLTPNSRLCMA